MAKLAAQAPELFRYFSPRHCRLLSVRADGRTLSRSPASPRWTHFRQKRADSTLAEWAKAAQARYDALPAWAKECKTLPTLAELERMAFTGRALTVTGDEVEEDGTGKDGAPSWLRALGFI